MVFVKTIIAFSLAILAVAAPQPQEPVDGPGGVLGNPDGAAGGLGGLLGPLNGLLGGILGGDNGGASGGGGLGGLHSSKTVNVRLVWDRYPRSTAGSSLVADILADFILREWDEENTEAVRGFSSYTQYLVWKQKVYDVSCTLDFHRRMAGCWVLTADQGTTTASLSLSARPVLRDRYIIESAAKARLRVSWIQ
ncbi:hypothetical protein BJV78DRAFT_1356418 [Lactifluus subvellereus]|nr:hypothetical protein BJV78DRAFT_1356418 [Lactifluus subvellereus]